MNNQNLVFPITLREYKNEGFKNISSNSIDILFNVRGVAKVSINGKITSFGKYDIVVVNPYDAFEIYHTNSTLFQIRINRSLLSLPEEYLNARFNCNSIEYTNKEKFHDLYLLVYNYIKDLDNITYLKATAIAYNFLNELYQDFKYNTTTKSRSQISEILDYIELNYEQNIMLKELADKFCLTVPYLSKKFKEETGKNFNDYYDEVRINHSMYELLDTNTPILDISLKNGFAGSQAYVRAYKKLYNILPSDARKEHMKQDNKEHDDRSSVFNAVINEFNEKALKRRVFKDYYISANYSLKPILIQKNISKEMVGIGGAKILLYKNIQDELIELQKNIHFEYCNIRGINCDDMSFVSRKYNGALYYRYNLINTVLDFIESINIKPVLTLLYMPQDLASEKNKTIYSDNYNTSAPLDQNEWNDMVKNLIEHCIERYGLESVKEWKFIPWSQPDSSPKQFAFNSDEEFFYFYRNTYETIKSINKDLHVLSPELLPITDKSFNFMKKFINYCTINQCMPESLSLLYFSEENIDELTNNYLHGKYFFVNHDIILSNNPDKMNNYLNKIRGYLNSNNINLPIYITAFNYTITQHHPILDTLFNANYVIKNYVDNSNLINSYSYWHISDFENNSLASDLFYGGSGMYLSNGIQKPVAGAFYYLSKLFDEIIAKGDGYIITRSSQNKDHLYMLLYNYEHPTDNPEIDFENDLYNKFINKERRKLHISLSGLPYEKAYYREYSINRYHGNPYDRWVLMGKPETQLFHKGIDVVSNVLKASSLPDYKENTINIYNNVLNLEFNLDPLEIKGIDIFLK